MSDTQSKCHCGEPADWMLQVVHVQSQRKLRVTDRWACCNTHVIDAYDGLKNKHTPASIIRIRRER